MTCVMTSTLAVMVACVVVDLATTKIPTSAVSCSDILHRLLHLLRLEEI